MTEDDQVDELDVLVVPRWNPFRQTRYVDGSSTDWRCSICRRRVVLAPSSVQLRESRHVQILCLECVPGFMKDRGVEQASITHLGAEPRD